MVGSLLTKGTYSAGRNILRRIAGEAQDAVTDSKVVGQTVNQIKGFVDNAAGKTKTPTSRIKPSAAINHIPEGTDMGPPISGARETRTEFLDKLAEAGGKMDDNRKSMQGNIGPIGDQVKKYNQSASGKAALAVSGEMPFEVGGVKVKEEVLKSGKIKKSVESEIPYMSYQELHHELMKALYSNYVEQAWKLIDDPLNPANEADIVNLNYLAKKYGFGFGDWGVVSYPRIAHQKAHDVLKAMKIQPTGQGLKDAVEAIGEFKNIDDLMGGFEKSLNEIAVPMRRQMELHNRAYGQFAEVDRINVIRFRKQKDVLKKKLLNVMQGALTAEGVEFPSKGVNGKTLLQLYTDSGLKPTKEMLDLDESIKAFRGKTKELESRMKKSLDPMIKKDIELDIDLMARIIEDQGQTPVDIPSRELQLMRDSYNQQAKPTYVYNE
tara:strand:+ start:110 stop:1417 length:1308 start_codon:yes stop_codon:yes gene_type:complete